MTRKTRPIRRPRQRGGTALGFVLGALFGLAVALVVALYVTKVPVPFVHKVQQRTSEQDAAEAERNRNWNPNGPLQSTAPLPPGAPQGGVPQVVAPGAGPTAAAPAGLQPVVPPGGAAAGARDPAAILGGAPTPGTLPMPVPEAIEFYVQAGAFQRTADAEQQRARLAMLGYTARITEREQAGRMVYRVRIGPYPQRAQAEALRDRMAGEGIEAALVRVQR